MTDSSQALERRYRRLLRLYPRSYREKHGEELLGVLMTDEDRGARHSRLAASLDLLRGAILVHTRYWWQMRSAVEHDRLAVRHPLVVIRVRLAVAIWLCIVAGVLWSRGYWWLGAGVALFIVVHLILAGRTAARYRAE
jgi:hypothetical protein